MDNGKFDWYTIVNNSDDITQGDIFINLPIIKINNYKKLLELDTVDESFELDYDIEYADYIVLTQPCDIAQKKPALENIILCRIFDVDEVGYSAENVEGFDKGELCSIIQGREPQFHILNKCEEFSYYDDSFNMNGFNCHVVNFDTIEKVPIDALKKYAKRVSKRLRLLPPYREHLSQAFAKYFMRIGLPCDIDRNLFNKYIKPKEGKFKR